MVAHLVIQIEGPQLIAEVGNEWTLVDTLCEIDFTEDLQESRIVSQPIPQVLCISHIIDASEMNRVNVSGDRVQHKLAKVELLKTRLALLA
jgi:hypothetical protein